MIVASESYLIPAAPGFIILQDSYELYYYVHKTFYEQAVIIQDRYGENIEALQKQIGGNSDFMAVKKFVENAPAPINIMGYFLAFLDNDIEDYEDIIGAMDVIATALNLRRLIMQPVEIRQSVRFSMSIQNEYRDRWDLFFQNCYDYNQVKAALSGSTPMDNNDSGGDGVEIDAEQFNRLMMQDITQIDSELEKKNEMPVESSTKDGLGVIAEAHNKRRAKI